MKLLIRDKDWRASVYKHETDEIPADWDEIRSRIIKRDQYTCYRCEMKSPRMNGLSVHHMIPRAEGGWESDDNLITLCHPCHDIVEDQGYRTRAEIMGSYDGDGVNYQIEQSDDKPKKTRTETFTRPSWHATVYGGRKRPH